MSNARPLASTVETQGAVLHGMIGHSLNWLTDMQIKAYLKRKDIVQKLWSERIPLASSYKSLL